MRHRARASIATWPLLTVALTLGVTAAACGPEGSAERSPDGVTGALAAGSLESVPEPDLDRLQPAVAEHLAALPNKLAAATAAAEDDPAAAAAAFGESGMVYLAYRLHAAALACFTNASHLAPEVLRWHHLRGITARESELDEIAAEALTQATAIDPTFLPAVVALAEVHLRAGRPAAAVKALETSLRHDPGDPAVLSLLGRAELASGDPRSAVERLERALELAPGADGLHHPLGLAYRQLGDEQRARDHLARRGEGLPRIDDPLLSEVRALASGAQIHANRGNEAFVQGDFAQAVQELRRAVDADPARPALRHNLAAALVRLGRREEAADELVELLASHPGYFRAHFTLGTLRAQQGRDGEAIGHYRRALQLNPDHRDTHLNLANALRRAGRTDEAVEHYRRAVELRPGDPRARFGEAMSLIELGRWRPARERLEAAHAALPGDPLLAATLARLLAACPVGELRDGPRALELARRLVAAENNLAHAEVLAMALAEVGSFELAVRQQEALLAAARTAGRGDLVARLAADLDRYRRRRASRLP